MANLVPAYSPGGRWPTSTSRSPRPPSSRTSRVASATGGTRFVVAGHAGQHALVEVELADRRPLFSPAVAVTVLALPGETVYEHRPDIDTGVPSQLARVAR